MLLAHIRSAVIYSILKCLEHLVNWQGSKLVSSIALTSQIAALIFYTNLSNMSDFMSTEPASAFVGPKILYGLTDYGQAVRIN